MAEGVITKALSGFYYVTAGEETWACRARGAFRKEGISPLVGDRVSFAPQEAGKGVIDALYSRSCSFIRPAVANIDLLIFVASAVIPVTDPYLIDRVAAIAESAHCGYAICVNKTDLDRGEELARIYSNTGYTLIPTSAETGEGLDDLRALIRGKICAFTGNTGVGKSSLLNALSPGLSVETGEVSHKLGRGKHTTRHVELFALPENTYIADTPGFASFDLEMMPPIPKGELQYCFPEFRSRIGECRFQDCAHLKEPGCAVLQAVEAGEIHPSRHEGYARLYALSQQYKEWKK